MRGAPCGRANGGSVRGEGFGRVVRASPVLPETPSSTAIFGQPARSPTDSDTLPRPPLPAVRFSPCPLRGFRPKPLRGFSPTPQGAFMPPSADSPQTPPGLLPLPPPGVPPPRPSGVREDMFGVRFPLAGAVWPHPSRRLCSVCWAGASFAVGRQSAGRVLPLVSTGADRKRRGGATPLWSSCPAPAACPGGAPWWCRAGAPALAPLVELVPCPRW